MYNNIIVNEDDMRNKLIEFFDKINNLDDEMKSVLETLKMEIAEISLYNFDLESGMSSSLIWESNRAMVFGGEKIKRRESNVKRFLYLNRS